MQNSIYLQKLCKQFSTIVTNSIVPQVQSNDKGITLKCLVQNACILFWQKTITVSFYKQYLPTMESEV